MRDPHRPSIHHIAVLALATVAIVAAAGAPAAGQVPAIGIASAAASPTPAQQTGPLTRLQVRVEFRERMESVVRPGFARNRDDVFWLSRLRLTLSMTPRPWLGLYVQLQDARVAGKQVGPTGAPFSAPADARLAYVEVGGSTSPVAVAIGRQELAFGEQRLVGHVNWVNAARTFDAARLVVRRDGLRVDAFASSVVRVFPDGWDRSGAGSQFHGLYVTSARVLPRSAVEPYFFWRANRNQRTEAGAVGSLRLATTGVRLAGQLPGGFDYGLESVVQRGNLGSETQRAFGQHLRLRSPAVWRARLVGEYNFASGDERPGDGRHGTFDPLYPTPHDKYGLADQVGWRNIHHARAAIEWAAVTRLPITAAWHGWWLANASDALYAAGGAPVARAPGGFDKRYVGQGIDVRASHTPNPYVQLDAGYAYIRPGAFLEAATPGAPLHAGYLMVTIAAATGR